MQWPASLTKFLSVMMVCSAPVYQAYAQTLASDWVLANGANEASWSYVSEAISNCTDYSTSIPKAEPTDPVIQVRVQKTLMDGKCKTTLLISNKATACFYTPDQRKAIQAEGTVAIGRLLRDENTCGAKAEQQVLANISEPITIQRLPEKEPLIAPSAGKTEKKQDSLVDRLKSSLALTKDEVTSVESKKPAKTIHTK